MPYQKKLLNCYPSYDLVNDNISELPADFERWTPYVRDLKKKQSVTSQSLEKIEDGQSALRYFTRLRPNL